MLKRSLIGIAVGLGAVVVGVGLTAFHYWQQATRLPEWYGQESQTNRIVLGSPQVEQERANLDARIASSLQQASGGPVDVQLTPQELNNLVASEISRHTAGSGLAQAVKGVNTTIQNGKVESGAVVNLAEVPKSSLSNRDRANLDRLLSAFPTLQDRSLYVGIEGKPAVQDGQLILDQNTRVKLGDLSFTLPEVAQRLGVSEQELQRQISLQLQTNGLKISDIELVGNSAVLRGTPQ